MDSTGQLRGGGGPLDLRPATLLKSLSSPLRYGLSIELMEIFQLESHCYKKKVWDCVHFAAIFFAYFCTNFLLSLMK